MTALLYQGAGCPPDEHHEGEVYRFVRSVPPTDADFKRYFEEVGKELAEFSDDEECQCEAQGVSFFAVDTVQSLWDRYAGGPKRLLRKRYTHAARVTGLPSGAGCSRCTNQSTGHVSWWPTEDASWQQLRVASTHAVPA